MLNLLVVSNIISWAVIVSLALVVFALTRQIGVLYERIAPAGALMTNKKIKAGDKAPELLVKTIDNAVINIGEPKAGRSQLLFFLSPDCPVCKSLLPVIRSSVKTEKDWLDIVLASDGDEMDHKGLITRESLQGFPYIVSELVGKAYGVAKLPYAVLIDEVGKIVSMGIVNSREHIESLFVAKDLGVSSIQNYLNQKVEVESVATK